MPPSSLQPPSALKGAPQPGAIDFKAGGKVLLHDLGVAKELNGQIGELHKFSDDTGRWRVKLPGGCRDIKPVNLTAVNGKVRQTKRKI